MSNDDGAKSHRQQIVFMSALDLLSAKESCLDPVGTIGNNMSYVEVVPKPFLRPDFTFVDRPAVADLHFPFDLKPDQVKAVEAWLNNDRKGSIIYGSGTGKTEIAFECARRAAESITKENNRFGTPRLDRRFNIVMLVPRIVLVQQNYDRLVKYGLVRSRIGKYFGEEKQIQEITISTYHSLMINPMVITNADMIIFDEMHLARRAFTKLFSFLGDISNKFLLGLTATIDESDPRNTVILSHMPPVRKYLIKDAVLDRRLARPVIFPVKVSLTDKELALYNQYSSKIRSISNRFKRYDANEIMALMTQGGFPRWQARAWFLNVKKRKHLLASADKKIRAATELIANKHKSQKVMVFSETLDSVRKLRQLLKDRKIESAIIDSRVPPFRRKRILSMWGSEFHVLLSVHTLEIGYDVPEAGVEIILATTSNMNQIVQRIGRVLRKVHGKESALVYLIYISDTRDDRMLELVKSAIESNGGSAGQN